MPKGLSKPKGVQKPLSANLARTSAPAATPARAKSLPKRPATPAKTLIAKSLVDYLTDALDDLKAEHIRVLPLAGKSSLADHLIIATGTSSRHLASLADRLTQTLMLHDAPFLGREGDTGSEWICVDAGDTIIHLFTPDARQLYNLEKLWSFPT